MSSYSLREDPGALTMILPAERNRYDLAVITIGTVIFSAIMIKGGLFSLLLQKSRNMWEWGFAGLGVLILLGLASVLGRWIFALLGRQLVTLNGVSLILRDEIFGLGVSREFEWNAVRDLRVALEGVPWMGAEILSPKCKARFCFDYGARTFSFGKGLDESSARDLLLLIQSRFPPVH